MRRAVPLFLICCAALAATATPAGAAATRAEYTAQINGICDSYVPEAKQVYRAFKKQAAQDKKRIQKRGIRGEKRDRIYARTIGRYLSENNRYFGLMLAEHAAVAPAPGDEALVAAWLQGRSDYLTASNIGARSLKRGKFKRGILMLFGAAAVLEQADANVKDFGLTSCVAKPEKQEIRAIAARALPSG